MTTIIEAAPKPRLKMVWLVSESAAPTFKLIDTKLFRYCPTCDQWKTRKENFFKGTGYCKACRMLRDRGKATQKRKAGPRPPRALSPLKGAPGAKPPYGAFAKLDLTTGMGPYIVQFLNAKATRSPKTVTNYRCTLSLFAQHIGNRWPYTADDINSFLASKKAEGRGLATISSYYRSIGNFSTWLHKRGKVESNPMEMAEKPPHAKPLPRAPSREDVQTLYNWLQRRVGRGADWRGERDLAIFSFMIDTGLRVGEVARLKISDLDLTRRVVTLRDTKTRADGTSVFGLGAAANLQAWLQAREKLDLPIALKDALFVGYVRGEWLPFSAWGIRQFLTRVCKEIDVPRITPHQLRHGCAVFSLQNGANIIDVQKQLRHRTPQMTMRYLMMNDTGREQRHLGYSPFDKTLGGESAT